MTGITSVEPRALNDWKYSLSYEMNNLAKSKFEHYAEIESSDTPLVNSHVQLHPNKCNDIHYRSFPASFFATPSFFLYDFFENYLNTITKI